MYLSLHKTTATLKHKNDSTAFTRFDLTVVNLFYGRNMWCVKSGVVHEYKNDIRTILSRKIPDYQQRSELEIEVLFKWILEVHDHDPTGIGSGIPLLVFM